MSISAKYGQSKIICANAKVSDFTSDLSISAKFEHIYHVTGWRLIVVVQKQIVSKLHVFKFYYGDDKWAFYLTDEILESYTWQLYLSYAIKELMADSDMAKDVEIIVEVDNDVNDQIKEWAKQFGTLKDVSELSGKAISHHTSQQNFSSLAKQLPGVNEIINYPCDCFSYLELKPTGTLLAVIIHLNDEDKWARESVADWLDTLEIDLSFKTPEKENNE